MLKIMLMSGSIWLQSRYLEPTVISAWQAEQEAVLAEVAELEGGLVIAGDGRCDSPGHCAKFGAYTLIECRLNKVIDIELVQVHNVAITVYYMIY